MMPIPGITAERDIAFGQDPLQKLDVFTSGTGAGKPVLLFAHGGGFTGGDKRRPGAFQADNIMIWAVQNGMVGINTNYRLAPKDPFPAAQHDLAAAIAWAKANAARYGGDPNKIVLMGQSAGASLVANHLAMPQFHPPGGPGVDAAYLSSGQFEVTEASDYYGNDPAKFAERSSFAGLLKTNVPLFVARAELDPPEIAAQSDKLNKALCDAGRCPTFLITKDHNHNSQLYAVGTGDETVTRPLLEFIRKYAK
jgi:triacylglycerol lipase